MKKRENLTAQAQVAAFRARQCYRASQVRAKRIGASIARAVIEKAVSDRALNDMLDMELYLGIPEDLALTLYLRKCVPNAAVREGLLRAAAA